MIKLLFSLCCSCCLFSCLTKENQIKDLRSEQSVHIHKKIRTDSSGLFNFLFKTHYTAKIINKAYKVTNSKDKQYVITRGEYSKDKIVIEQFCHLNGETDYCNWENYYKTTLSIGSISYNLDELEEIKIIKDSLHKNSMPPIDFFSNHGQIKVNKNIQPILILNGQPFDCNGVNCVDHHLLVISQNNIYSIKTFYYYPFNFKNIPILDINNDKKIDYIVINPISQSVIKVNIVSIINGKIELLRDYNSQPYYVTYNIGDDNSIFILDANWF